MSRLSDYGLKWKMVKSEDKIKHILFHEDDESEEIASITARKISSNNYELTLLCEEMGINLENGNKLLDQWGSKIITDKNLNEEIKGIKKFISGDLIKREEY